MFLSLNLENWN